MCYLVIIRTLMGGGKYRLLLESIAVQSIKAEHIFVVQPYGYAQPKEKLGFEEYIQCEKGMWRQRIYGMEHCYQLLNRSKYLLVCDDDVSFQSDYVERLIGLSEQYDADIMVPMADFKFSSLKRIINFVLGGPIYKDTCYRNVVLSNGCWAYNNSLSDNVNPTQSGNFQSFLMKTDIVPTLELQDELWIDETRYAWPDDMMFFYKAHLKGYNVLSCKDPIFSHNDGQAGVTNAQRKYDSAYSIGRNGYIFWHRFIYEKTDSSSKKLFVRLSFKYRSIVMKLLYLVLGINRRDFNQLRAYKKGLYDGHTHKILK